MRPIPPDASSEDIDRQTVEVCKARQGEGWPTYPAERVRALLAELETRFTAAGTADPAVVAELLATLRRGNPS